MERAKSGHRAMHRRLLRGLAIATATCGLLAAGPAAAGGTGMPWEGPLQQIVQSITGPVVQAAAVIAIAIFGAGIAMSESGSAMRRGLGILFGLSIAFAASTFFLGFFGFAGGVEIG
jgi:type IV secretory pathway VirB2 component (pilin)